VGIGGATVQVNTAEVSAVARTVTLGTVTNGVYSPGELDVLNNGLLNANGTVNPALQVLPEVRLASRALERL
jgi:hypothetical protein